MNPLDIVQRTPKTNCGQCGYPTCLAFAANVARSGEDPRKCPFLRLDGLVLDKQPGAGLDKLGEQHDLELVRRLRGQIADLDLAAITPALGIHPPSAENDGRLSFSYLNHQVLLDQRTLLIDGREPEDPRDQILLYNYIRFGGGAPPTGEWIGLESLPNSISKVKTLARYCEEPLARLFAGQSRTKIIAACRSVGAAPLSSAATDLTFLVPVLPRLPQQLLFWDEEKEDAFPARVKILYDAGVLDYLDLESLVFSSERLAEKIIRLFTTTP
ncbi:MAG: DUF3786 domain-containing protein [Thermodesulfobacteriota bacterium]